MPEQLKMNRRRRSKTINHLRGFKISVPPRFAEIDATADFASDKLLSVYAWLWKIFVFCHGDNRRDNQ